MQRQLQSNKLVQWGVLFLALGLGVNLIMSIGRILMHYTGWFIFAGLILLVVGLIRGK